MSEPFLGEIRMFGFTFAPRGWAFCKGQSLSVAQNSALFALLGVTYGGDGQNTFNLPNLQSRVAVGAGQGTGLSSYVQGQMSGAENVTLTQQQMPAHQHTLNGDNNPATTNLPSGGNLAQAGTGGRGSVTPVPSYTTGTPGSTVALNGSSIGTTGNSQPHTNIQPVLAMNYCIAIQGIFPSRN